MSGSRLFKVQRFKGSKSDWNGNSHVSEISETSKCSRIAQSVKRSG